jgi:hypothetical protein
MSSLASRNVRRRSTDGLDHSSRLLRKREVSFLIITLLAVNFAIMICYFELLSSADAFAPPIPWNAVGGQSVPATTSNIHFIGRYRRLYSTSSSRVESRNVPTAAAAAAAAAPRSTTNDGTIIEGILNDEEFDRLVRIDKTIRELRAQLPTLLTQPLAMASAAEVYVKDNFRLNVLVVDQAGAPAPSEGGDERPLQAEGEIAILNSREDLMALSDILVLATTAARQAGAAMTAGTADTQVEVKCQLILDDSLSVIRIPWKAKAPLLGSPDSNNNLFEGLTDFRLRAKGGDDVDDDDFGKVQEFTIRKLTWNGRPLNGPAIGQAVKAVQSTVTNLQQSPLLQTLVRAGDLDRTASFLTELRDGFLGQAATALSASSGSGSSGANQGKVSENKLVSVPVYQVKSIKEVSGWIDQPQSMGRPEAKDDSNDSKGQSRPPCPGTKGWKEYAASRECLIRFCDDIIPQLSDLSIVDASLFAKNATLITTDGSTVITGQESLANFYQSMALTRTGTGGSFKATGYEVLDWKFRTVALHYEATISSLPLWTIQGCDVYRLDALTTDQERPIIRQIRQRKLTAVNPTGKSEISIDGPWMIKNLVAAINDDGSAKASRDFWTELLMQQPGLNFIPQGSIGQTKAKTMKKLSEAVAAKSYYIMTDLYGHGFALFDLTSSRTSPPGAEYMAPNVELRGYLGESILRGSTLYNPSIGSVIFGIRDALRQKRVVVEKLVAPRVELIMPAGDVRLSLTLIVRIPPPGAGVILPESALGPPIKLELVSDYKIDANTGSIAEHRLVETRVNDQLTPGDQVSRWIQRVLKMEGATEVGGNDNGSTDTFKAFSEALSWIRSLNGPDT